MFRASSKRKKLKQKYKEMRPLLKTVIKSQQTAEEAEKAKAKAVEEAEAAQKAAAEAAEKLMMTQHNLPESKGGRKRRRKSRKVKKSRKHRGGKKTKKGPVLVDAYCRRSRKKTRRRK